MNWLNIWFAMQVTGSALGLVIFIAIIIYVIITKNKF